jgi:hypothetical protein
MVTIDKKNTLLQREKRGALKAQLRDKQGALYSPGK